MSYINNSIFYISIFLIISLVFVSCKNEPKSKLINKPELQTELKAQYLVDKKEISELFNYCFKTKTKIFKNCKYIWNQDPVFYFTESDSLEITKMDSIFTKDDLNFIFKQALNNPRLKLDGEIIASDKLVPLDIEKAFNSNRKIREKYLGEIRSKYDYVCTLSIPLFSKNRKVAIVKIGYVCGPLCGEGGIYIYRKTNDGKWDLIKTISDWVS